MFDNNQKPIILLLIQGWGLNLSWRNNAIASSKASNFNNLWRNYSHLILKSSNKNKIFSKKMSYSLFYRDDDFKSNEQITDKFFQNSSIGENKSLQEISDQISKHNSKLHIIYTISENDDYGEIDILLRLIKTSKSNGTYQQYVHLFVESFSSPSKIFDKVELLQNKLSQIGTAGIATITSLKTLYSNGGLIGTLQALVLGKGKRILSLHQAYIQNKNFFDRSCTYIISSDRTMISDFDAVIFFDNAFEPVMPLSRWLSSKADIDGVRRPKYLSVSYLVESPSDKRHDVLCTNYGSSWIDTLENKKITVVASQIDFDFLSSIIDIPSSIEKVSLQDIKTADASTESSLKGLSQYLRDKLKKKKDDLIIVDLPYLFDVCRNGTFSETKKVIQSIDAFLPALESLILEADGVLLISSFFGMAEDVTKVSSVFGERTQLSSNSLPVIEISQNSKKTGQKDLALADLVNLKYGQSDLKQIILNHLREQDTNAQ